MEVLLFSVSVPALLSAHIQGKGQVPHKIPAPFFPFPTLSFLPPEPVVDGEWTLSPLFRGTRVSFPHSQELLRPENSAQLQQLFEVRACCTLNRLARELPAVDEEDHWQITLSTAHREMGCVERQSLTGIMRSPKSSFSADLCPRHTAKHNSAM